MGCCVDPRRLQQITCGVWGELPMTYRMLEDYYLANPVVSLYGDEDPPPGDPPRTLGQPQRFRMTQSTGVWTGHQTSVPADLQREIDHPTAASRRQDLRKNSHRYSRDDPLYRGRACRLHSLPARDRKRCLEARSHRATRSHASRANDPPTG